MYKRPAHILFLGRQTAQLELVCELSEQLAVECLQARSIELEGLEPGDDRLAWADLLVAIDEYACGVLENVQGDVPYRCWELPGDNSLWREYCAQALLSMAGGMRMMQRLED